MKKTIFAIFIMTAGFTMAQWTGVRPNNPPTYNKKSPPPLSLSEAYGLALATLGKDTNQFYCISASCEDLFGFPRPSGDGKGWTFDFSSTNGTEKVVGVSFDRGTISWSNRGPFGFGQPDAH